MALILIEGRAIVLYFESPVPYSRLQDVHLYYGTLKSVAINNTGHTLNQISPVKLSTVAFVKATIQHKLQYFKANFPEIRTKLIFPVLRLAWHFDLFTGRVLG